MCKTRLRVFLLTVFLLTVPASATLVDWWKFDDGSGTTAADSGSLKQNGTLVNSPTWNPAGVQGGCLQFNGTNNRVNVTGSWPLPAYTVAVWFKQDAAVTVQKDIFSLEQQSVAVGAGGIMMEIGTDGRLRFLHRAPFSGTGGAAIESLYTPAVTAGVWHHWAVVKTATDMTSYVDGVQAGTQANPNVFTTPADTITIGDIDSRQMRPWNGLIDDVRIYDTALSAAEVLQAKNGTTSSTASIPSPASGATDVPRDVVLAWKPGPTAATHDVYFGTAFADVNAASRTAPAGLLVSKGQDANTYDLPGILQFGQTYYWRVDEVNAPPGSTIFTGSVWSFTAEPLFYPVTNIVATASSFNTGAGPENTINGSGLNALDQHGTDNPTMWLTAKGTTPPAWIQYDLGRVRKVESMIVWNYNAMFEDIIGIGAKGVTVEYSIDGITWTALAGVPEFAQGIGDPSYAANTTVNFGGVAARYVKLTITSTWGAKQTGLSEVRFLEMIDFARSPQPASGATGVSPSTTLSWRSGREAASANVYIGTDPNVLTLSGTSPTNSFAPATLGLGIKYYWRVDEVNAAATPSTWAGDVWNFTTPDFLVVDDMESYNDTTNKMFDVWVDGYGTATNGSQVGYGTSANSTFGETVVLHGGKQSMPFAYGNTAPISVSEATRTFATAQNWTVAKADTLRLWVEGRAGNLPTGTLPAATTTFDITGAGSDIYQATDQFRFVYAQLTSDGSITARVDFQQPTSQYAKAGVMIRVGLNPGALQAYMATLPGTPNTTPTPRQVEWSFRPTVGDATARSVSTTPTPMAPWVRLTRSGDVLTGAYSVDGVTWVSTGITATPQTIAMGSPVNIGLIVCSHVATQLGEAKFSNVKTTGNVTGGWQVADIGITTLPASNTADTFYVTLTDGAGHSKTAIPTVANPVCTTGMWQSVDFPFSQFTGVTMSSIKSMVIGVGDKTNPLHGSGLLYIDDIGVGHPAP